MLKSFTSYNNELFSLLNSVTVQLFCSRSKLLVGIGFSDRIIGSYNSVAMKDFFRVVNKLIIFSSINERTGAIAVILSLTPDISEF